MRSAPIPLSFQTRHHTSVVTLSNISRIHERGGTLVHALRNVSLELAPGEFVGVTGPSGSGKSTLLNILGLSDAPTSGQLLFSNTPVDYTNESQLIELRRTFIGYVFQSFNLISALTAVENVAMSVMLHGTSYAAACQTAAALLTRAGLGHRLTHLPGNLSGGEMQRVAVCRAVIHRPSLILADEPTGNLDTSTGDIVLNLLRDYAGGNTTVVMATHSDRALQWCSRRIALRDGELCV